ncbi:MAG: PorT family protein [Sphingobacteriales bacterium]|nr:PorT family protein [Sphingobacteriales bacterium]
MKHLFYITGVIIAFVCHCSVAYGQVSVGVHTGINSSKMFIRSDDDPQTVENTYWKTRFMVGIPIEIALSKHWALQPELNYVQKGWNFNAMDTLGNHAEIDLRFDYLELPLLLKYTKQWKKTHFYAFGGPYFSYTNHIRASLSSVLGNPSETIKPKDIHFSSYDVGFYAGVGIGRKIGIGTLSAEIRYGHSIANIMQKEYSDGTSMMNRNFQFLVSYRIPLGVGVFKKNNKQ